MTTQSILVTGAAGGIGRAAAAELARRGYAIAERFRVPRVRRGPPPATGQIVFSGHSPGGVKAWADMERLQQRELTTSFVSGWTRGRIESTLELMRSGALPLERFAGAPSATEADIMATIRAVLDGILSPVAAVLDWRDLQ